MTFSGFPYAQPGHGLLGGLLIGIAGALMLLGTGRIAGVSGITARATGIGTSEMPRSDAWAFLFGLPIGATAATLALDLDVPRFAPWPLLVVAGLLVGFGTRLGSGCTSGHGVCGVSRLSQRSLVATATFIVSGIATVAFMTLIGGR